MRIPGLIHNDGAEVALLQHRGTIESCQERREEWERWYSTQSGCPWGCDGSGVQEIALYEFGPWDHIPDPLLEVVLPTGLILTPCECSYYNR